jgi:hypothetical protein
MTESSSIEMQAVENGHGISQLSENPVVATPPPLVQHIMVASRQYNNTFFLKKIKTPPNARISEVVKLSRDQLAFSWDIVLRKMSRLEVGIGQLVSSAGSKRIQRK